MDEVDNQLKLLDEVISETRKEIKRCKAAGAKAKMLRSLKELLDQRRSLLDDYNYSGEGNLCDSCRFRGTYGCNQITGDEKLPESYYSRTCEKYEPEESEESEEEEKSDGEDG